MAEPEADRSDVDEAKEALGGLIVAGGVAAGVLQLVETPLDEIAQQVECAVDGHAQLPGLARRMTGTTLRASIVFRTLSES